VYVQREDRSRLITSFFTNRLIDFFMALSDRPVKKANFSIDVLLGNSDSQSQLNTNWAVGDVDLPPKSKTIDFLRGYSLL
jgi:hypothetical protein